MTNCDWPPIIYNKFSSLYIYGNFVISLGIAKIHERKIVILIEILVIYFLNPIRRKVVEKSTTLFASVPH